MKKLIALSLLASLLFASCARPANEPKELVPIRNASDHYIVDGHYYTDGTIVTADGNAWNYSTDKPINNDAPVYVLFDDNGPADDIYDDIIVDIYVRKEL